MRSQTKLTILSGAVGVLMLFAGAALGRAQETTAATPLNTTINLPAQPKVVRTIVVSLKDRRLALLENGQVMAVYPVAVGKPSTPSPTGTFTIVNHVINPTYYHRGRHHGVVIPPGPNNPVGNRWMGLSIPGYGIHGTNTPRSVGRAVSHGCIRLSRRDLDRLFAQVHAGDAVVILADRNQETASIFGDGAAQHTATAPVLTAKAAPEKSSTKPAPVTVAMAMPVGQ